MGRRARDASPTHESYEYDDRLDDVSRALENLDRPGSCFVSGSFTTFPHPGVVIRSNGDEPNVDASTELLALPLTDATASRVISKCRLAPYGHGEKTLVDTRVRNTWELNASEIQITNPEWESFIHDMLRTIRAPLGIAATALVEAKLYKLLIYETGGKFERHQDSEKEPGMFGTLVVVLPCTFTGGELLVHEPSATTKRGPHEWSPGEQSVYDVKYAAFYGDCAHEVKPVTSGYRLCLTYNLVTTTVTEIPRFAGQSKVQESIEWALSHYFTEPLPPKRPKYSSWSTTPTPSPHRHFVYVLEHDYSDQGLRFEYLKNKDRLVALSLAKFCEATKGEYVLYLSKLHYSHVSDPDVPDVEPEITVTLQSPWVKYGTTRAAKCPDVEVEHEYEIAPSGYLEGVDFDDVETEYTGNEGTREDQWYDTAALVIQPITKEFNQLVQASTDDVAATLAQLVNAGSPRATEFASRILTRTQDWTSGSLAFATCLETLIRLGEPHLFFGLLRSATGFEFQAQIRDAVVHFGWDYCLPTLLTVGQQVKARSRINLVASILHNETDTARIASVLNALDVTLAKLEPPQQPLYAWRPAPVDPFFQPTIDEYSRILHLARQVSVDTLTRCTTTCNDETLINLVVPAFQSFVASLPSVDAAMSGLVRSLRGQLCRRLPALRNAGFSEIKVDHTCIKCQTIQAFLSSDSEERGVVVAKHKTEFKHLEAVLKRTRARRNASLSYKEIAPFTLELTKHFGDDRLHVAALAAVQRLEETLAEHGANSSTDMVGEVPVVHVAPIQLPPLQPLAMATNTTPRSLPPPASVVATPRLTAAAAKAEPEIIVIDDSDSD